MASVPADVDELAELVVAARAGDRAAFDDLVRATHVEVYVLARRLTGDPDDARDVVQDAYLRAYRGLGTFRGDARFRTWLHRIVANCSITHRQRRSRHRHDELIDGLEGPDVSPDVDPLERLVGRGLRERIERAIGALPPKLRAVVVLRELHGLSHRDIADQLGITEAAAKVRLHRARRRLRDDLGDGDEAGERRRAG